MVKITLKLHKNDFRINSFLNVALYEIYMDILKTLLLSTCCILCVQTFLPVLTMSIGPPAQHQ